MARINVDQQALTDARFARLAELRGWADADHARGKMLKLWNECIHRGPVLEAWIIDYQLGAGAAGDLLESQLGELVKVAGAVAGDPAGKPAGGTLVRIKGTDGRTDYLQNKINAAKAGGKARAESAQRVAGRFTSQRHQPVAGEPPTSQTSAPAPAPAPDTKGITPTTSGQPSAPEKRKHRLPADWQPSDRERLTAREKGLDCDAEAEHFRDHHTAKGEPHLDWHAAFRNWLRNAVKFANKSRQPSLPGSQPLRKEPEL